MDIEEGSRAGGAPGRKASLWQLRCSLGVEARCCPQGGVGQTRGRRCARHFDAVLHALLACNGGATPDNAEWIRRKRNVTLRFHRSSYAIGLELARDKTTLEQRHGLKADDYMAHGGSFPASDRRDLHWRDHRLRPAAAGGSRSADADACRVPAGQGRRGRARLSRPFGPQISSTPLSASVSSARRFSPARARTARLWRTADAIVASDAGSASAGSSPSACACRIRSS